MTMILAPFVAPIAAAEVDYRESRPRFRDGLPKEKERAKEMDGSCVRLPEGDALEALG
jgi:hypothetical protein